MAKQDNLHNADGIQDESSKNTQKSTEQVDNEDTSKTVEEPTEGSNQDDKTHTNETINGEEQNHVSEIDEANAEDAEDDSNAERHQLQDKDYHAMSMEDLVKELAYLLKNHKIQTISKQVNTIKSEFNTKFSELLDEKKEAFLSEGGNEIDFYYSNATKKEFNTLYKEYKKSISAYYDNRAQQLKQNLENRLSIIEEIKNLINVEENINTTYKHFKDLQEKWRNAGPIPREKYNNTWNTYHHHVEIFYDFLHLNNDLRDMDFKHNYEQKLKLIEQAEALAKEENVNKAFRDLQVLHKIWKEDLGPVAKEHREAIWERFSQATKTIHDKRQAYYADLEKAYEKNLERKENIIADIETIANQDIKSHNAWQKKIKEIEQLREAFFNAGKVPINVNEATWAKFKNAVRTFNRNKNAFYKSLKKTQYENLEQKKALIKIAEDNKDSEDFESVTPLMKKIQSDWKKIGHVPRKDSDKIWKQFKNACNHYFDRLHAERKAENKELYEAFEKKSELLSDLNELKFSDDTKANVALLKSKIEEFKAIGHVPHNKRYIDGKFYKAVDKAFNQLNMEKDQLEMVKFESKLEGLANADNDDRLLDNEQHFIKKRISEVKSEITQFENNLQFFSNVDSSNPLVKDVHKKINKKKKELEVWKQKLSKLKSMYN